MFDESSNRLSQIFFALSGTSHIDIYPTTAKCTRDIRKMPFDKPCESRNNRAIVRLESPCIFTDPESFFSQKTGGKMKKKKKIQERFS